MPQDEPREDAAAPPEADSHALPRTPMSDHWWVRARLRAVYLLMRLLRVGSRG
jgi:hypothetical protein